jgi:hypothetical protein
MNIRRTIAVSAVALASALSAQAEAATWNFSYTGVDGLNTIVETGTVTTDNTAPLITYQGAGGAGPSLFGYDVVGIAGTRSEGGVTQQITGLVGTAGFVQWVPPSSDPVSLEPGWYYDNIFYGSGGPSWVDLRGVEYAAISNGVTSLYDVYFANGTYFENYTPLGGAAVSAAPLPAALPLFGAALVGLGIFGWRKRRSTGVS